MKHVDWLVSSFSSRGLSFFFLRQHGHFFSFSSSPHLFLPFAHFDFPRDGFSIHDTSNNTIVALLRLSEVISAQVRKCKRGGRKEKDWLGLLLHFFSIISFTKYELLPGDRPVQRPD
jgi:hypothetical protein